jgi:outer membrane protein OmpA-like peptidoglycan-associated protein
MKSTLFTMGLVLLVAGCASRAPTPAPRAQAPASQAEARAEAPPPAPAPAAPKVSPLASEQRWLAQWFEGTPVAVQTEADGSVQLTVPTVHSFDQKSTTPKPALKAVLDKVGQSLKRKPTTRLAIAAPGQAGTERAQAARQHLLARGVAKHRVTAAPTDTNAVVLRLSLAPAPIGRLEDSRQPTLARQPSH